MLLLLKLGNRNFKSMIKPFSFKWNPLNSPINSVFLKWILIASFSCYGNLLLSKSQNGFVKKIEYRLRFWPDSWQFCYFFVCFALSHYGRFGVFLSKIGMHVKTVQIEFFAIKIIISIHISSFKKVLPKYENWQKSFLILLTESWFFWTFFALY